jgi:PAS domain S-box-containing protein
MPDVLRRDADQLEELEALRARLMELEEIEVMRVTEEQERFNSLQVLDEYAKQLEESRDKLARLLRAGSAVQSAGTVQQALQKIADAVGHAGWGSVSVGLFDNWQVVQSAYFGCSQSDIEYLETHRRPPEDRARFYGPDFERFKISRSYFVPADSLSTVISMENVVPGRREVQPGDTWDPMDLAYVPLYGTNGKIIGSINCDDPVDGRRPTAETFFYIELFADLAARKVETAHLLEGQYRSEAARRQTEEKYRAVFEGSADGFFLMDELFRDCNPKACELWACTPEEIIGHSPVEFSPEFQPDGRRSSDVAHEYIAKAMAGDPQRFYWVHKRKDGFLLDCEVTLATVNLNGERLVHAIVRDITKRRSAERERETILRILEIANSPDSQERMIPRIFEEIGKVVPIENYYLAIYDENTGLTRFPHFVDAMDSPPPPLRLGNTLTSWVIRRGCPLRLDSKGLRRLEKAGKIELLGSPAKSWLGVPLKFQSRSIGALVVQSYDTDGRYTKEHQHVLSAVAGQIAGAVERARAEEALRFTQFTVDRAADALFWIGRDGGILYVNDAACKQLGYSRMELLSMNVSDLEPGAIPTDQWDAYWEEVKRVGAVTRETCHRTKSGDSIPVELSVNHLEYDGKEVHCAFARDISERNRVNEERQAMAALVENSSEAIVMATEQGKLLYLNDAAANLVGVPDVTEALAIPFEQFLAPESFEAITAARSAAIDEGHWEGELLVRRLDNSELVPVQVHSFTIRRPGSGEVAAIGAVAHDLTERKKSEQAVRESREQYRGLVELSPDAVVVHQDGKVVYANAAAARLYGADDVEHLLGRTVVEFVHPDDREIVAQRISEMLAKGIDVPLIEERFLRLDGSTMDVEVAAISSTFQGKPAVQVVCREITERKRAGADLARFRKAVESSGEVIFMTDSQGIIVFVNEEFTRLYGYAPEEVVGKVSPRILKSSVHSPDDYRLFWEALKAKQVVKGELVNRDKQGRIVHVEGSANPILDDHGVVIGYLAVQRDISDRKHSEERISLLNQCFLSFGPEPVENINRLVALCGELMDATCALYSVLDAGMLCSIGTWRAPADLPRVSDPQGHICHDIITRGSDEFIVVRDLQNSPYYATDPDVRNYDLRTYAGQAVKCGESIVGSLCVVYQRDVVPTEEGRKLMGVVAAAIGIEEARIRGDASRRESDENLRWLMSNLDEAVMLSNVDECLLYANAAMGKLMGCGVDALVGHNLSEFLDEDSYEFIKSQTKLRRDGVRSRYTLNMKDYSGHCRTVEIMAMPQFDDHGNVTKVFSMVHEARTSASR